MTAEPRVQILRQPRRITKHMFATRNIEQQPLWRVQHASRRITLTPIGEPAEQIEVRHRIMVKDRQIGHAGAGIGERHSGRQAKRMRRRITCRQPHGPALFFDHGKRRIRRAAAMPDQSLCR